MARSFTKSKVLTPPKWCLAPPPTMLPTPLGQPPPMLAGMARWADSDPLAPTDMASYIDLEATVPGIVWEGATPKTGYRLELQLTKLFSPDTYRIRLAIYDPWRNPELFVWPTVNVRPDQPFDTGLIQDIFIPGQDFRLVQIMV